MTRWYELDKYETIIREWHPDNPKKIEEAKSGDTEQVLWKCSRGHNYKERLTYRLHLGRSCPICSGQLHLAKPGGSISNLFPSLQGLASNNGFTADDLSADENALLVCQAGHQFVFWGGGTKQGCRRCQKQEEITEYTSHFQPGEAFPSPKEYPGSREEDRLRRFLLQEGVPLDPPSTAVKLRELFFNWDFAVPDIVVQNTRLAIEYDSWDFHAGADERDNLKRKLLTNVGWKLIRVRCQGLAVEAEDIQVNQKATLGAAKQIAAIYLSNKNKLRRQDVQKLSFPG